MWCEVRSSTNNQFRALRSHRSIPSVPYSDRSSLPCVSNPCEGPAWSVPFRIPGNAPSARQAAQPNRIQSVSDHQWCPCSESRLRPLARVIVRSRRKRLCACYGMGSRRVWTGRPSAARVRNDGGRPGWPTWWAGGPLRRTGGPLRRTGGDAALDRNIRRGKVFGEFDEPDHGSGRRRKLGRHPRRPPSCRGRRALPTSSAIAGSITHPRRLHEHCQVFHLPGGPARRRSSTRSTGCGPHAGAGKQLDGPSIEPVRECPAGSRG